MHNVAIISDFHDWHSDQIDFFLKENVVINWKSKNARWYVGMFVEDSDYVKNRNTATNVTKANY